MIGFGDQLKKGKDKKIITKSILSQLTLTHANQELFISILEIYWKPNAYVCNTSNVTTNFHRSNKSK